MASEFMIFSVLSTRQDEHLEVQMAAKKSADRGNLLKKIDFILGNCLMLIHGHKG